MKLIITLFFIVSSSPAYPMDLSFGLSGPKYPDDEMTTFSKNVKDRILKIRKMIDKNDKCVVAVYGSFKRYFPMNASENMLPTSVDCIADIVINEGTLHEQSGCALVQYNLDKDKYLPYFNSYFPKAISKKTCSNGGFEELMQLKGYWSGNAYQDSTVEETIFTPASIEEPWQYVLVYAKNDKYVKWFNDARDRGKVFVTKRSEKKTEPKKK